VGEEKRWGEKEDRYRQDHGTCRFLENKMMLLFIFHENSFGSQLLFLPDMDKPREHV